MFVCGLFTFVAEQAYPYEAGYGGQFGKTERQPHRYIFLMPHMTSFGTVSIN